MRIHIHDTSGHAFQVQLSRELAARGHVVLHSHIATFQSPKGDLCLRPDDPPGLRIEALDLGAPFAKYDYLRRYLQERKYGRALAELIRDFKPDVVVLASAALDTMRFAQRYCKAAGIPFVFCLQDLYGTAISRLLTRKIGKLGGLIGAHYRRLESRLLAGSDHIVAITEDFLPFIPKEAADQSRVSVIHNWAPINELPVREQVNAWSSRQGLAGKFVFLYSGTLGLKHNPEYLFELARRYQTQADVRVVVISEGIGAQWLQNRLASEPLPNLLVLPFQPVAEVPMVLAAAEVLMSVLEADAGVFSVPSKVLAYFCAARPVLLSAPVENLAARLVAQNQAGLISAPEDLPGFIANAGRLYREEPLRRQAGASARRYAEANFEIGAIADRYEGIIRRLNSAKLGEARAAGAA